MALSKIDPRFELNMLGWVFSALTSAVQGSQQKQQSISTALSGLAKLVSTANYTSHWSPGLWERAFTGLPYIDELERLFRQDQEAFQEHILDLAKLLFNCAT
jgi:hypothetical protein